VTSPVPLSSAPFDSEDAFLRALDLHFPNDRAGTLLGRGDDCCLLETPGRLLLSADLFLEHRHFRRAYFRAWDIGWKGLAVNLSDIAAMGGRPLGFCLALMAPAGLDAAFWNELFTGMAALANQWELSLVGGDLSAADALGLSITIWGAPGPGGRALTRGGSSPGDALFLVDGGGSGEPLRLGLARVGLLALEAEGPDAASRHPQAVAAHLRPRPLLEEGARLAARGGVNGLMDLSDGLAQDLPRLLGARPERAAPHGAALTLASEDLHPELLDFAERQGLDPVTLAVLGGEDYALCGTMPWEEWERAGAPGARLLGRVTRETGVRVNGRPFLTPGYDHFSGRGSKTS
jgi:thiamine-monophosphate kinase